MGQHPTGASRRRCAISFSCLVSGTHTARLSPHTRLDDAPRTCTRPPARMPACMHARTYGLEQSSSRTAWSISPSSSRYIHACTCRMPWCDVHRNTGAQQEVVVDAAQTPSKSPQQCRRHSMAGPATLRPSPVPPPPCPIPPPCFSQSASHLGHSVARRGQLDGCELPVINIVTTTITTIITITITTIITTIITTAILLL